MGNEFIPVELSEISCSHDSFDATFNYCFAESSVVEKMTALISL